MRLFLEFGALANALAVGAALGAGEFHWLGGLNVGLIFALWALAHSEE